MRAEFFWRAHIVAKRVVSYLHNQWFLASFGIPDCHHDPYWRTR